jgi:hypothetical protein
MKSQSDKATAQYKQVSQQIKPFLNLGKIQNKKSNGVVIQKDKLLTYKFTDGSIYCEFNISYPAFGYDIDNDVAYDLSKIDTDEKSVFYTDNVVNKIEHLFNQKYSYCSLVFRTNQLVSSVKEIISENKGIDIMVCRFSNYDNLQTLTFLPWFQSKYSFYQYCFNGLFIESIENCETKVKPRYLELALSHGYKYSQIFFGRLNTPIVVYGSDSDYFEVPKFRAVIMNMYTNEESIESKLDKLKVLRESLRNS